MKRNHCNFAPPQNTHSIINDNTPNSDHQNPQTSKTLPLDFAAPASSPRHPNRRNLMDVNKSGAAAGSTRFWTNERHVHFLNSIEATFVRGMFETFDVAALPLDRQMPDSQESTLDSAKDRRSRRYSTSDVAEYSSGRNNKRSSALSSHHRDQVVPQVERRMDDGAKTKNHFHGDDNDKYQKQYH